MWCNTININGAFGSPFISLGIFELGIIYIGVALTSKAMYGRDLRLPSERDESSRGCLSDSVSVSHLSLLCTSNHLGTLFPLWRRALYVKTCDGMETTENKSYYFIHYNNNIHSTHNYQDERYCTIHLISHLKTSLFVPKKIEKAREFVGAEYKQVTIIC